MVATTDTDRSAPPCPNSNSTPPPPPRQSTTRRVCELVCILVIIGFILLFSWAFYMAAVWDIDYPNFLIESASVSHINTTGSTLTATWEMTLLVDNPNKRFKISYDDIGVVVSYGHQGLAKAQHVGPFVMKEKSRTRVALRVEAVAAWFGDGVAQEIFDWDHGAVSFGVSLLLNKVKYKGILTPVYTEWLHVNCAPLDIGLSRNTWTGSLTGQLRWCDVSNSNPATTWA